LVPFWLWGLTLEAQRSLRGCQNINDDPCERTAPLQTVFDQWQVGPVVLANSSDRALSWHKWQTMDDVIALKVFYEDHGGIVDDRCSLVWISLDAQVVFTTTGL
jgi:hypothetical protein